MVAFVDPELDVIKLVFERLRLNAVRSSFFDDGFKHQIRRLAYLY